MSQVTMLASFNYEDPSTGALVIGAGVAIVILIALAFSRSALAGLFGGAISWGLIAVVVFGTGSGDMTGLMQTFFGVFFGVVGAVAGLVAGLIGKATKSSRPPQEQQIEGDNR